MKVYGSMAGWLPVAALGVFVYLLPTNAWAEDWPMWRYDSQRSAASPNELPSRYELLWSVSHSERQPVWDDPLNQDLMSYDSQFEPIVLGGRIFIGFNDQDKLVALDTATGQTLWTFFADAPVRLPPVAWKDCVLFCSDDGFMYCLKADSGQLLWSFRGGPNSQKALGNQRLTSAWPARGGPVVYEDTVYFAASIWPFMGTFIYALDANTGSVRWINDSTGAQYIKQPHSAPSFAGVGPQGALVATQDYLIVPGGRSVPAVFQRSNGQFVHFEINAGGKGTGGSFVAADSLHFYVHTREKGTRAFNTTTGLKTAFTPNEPVITGNVLYAATLSSGQPQIHAYRANLDDDKNRESLWSLEASAMEELIGAKDHLVAAGNGKISIIRRPELSGEQLSGGELIKQLEVAEPVARMLVADHKLFVVFRSGRVAAFGAPASDKETRQANWIDSAVGALSQQIEPEKTTPDASQESEKAVEMVRQLLSMGDSQGYALWYGPCSHGLLRAWFEQSPFVQLAIVDSDAGRVDRARQYLDSIGAYGKITVHLGTPESFRAPQYIANQVFVSEDLAAEASDMDITSAYASVRPYGGSLTFVPSGSNNSNGELTRRLMDRLQKLELEQAELSSKGNWVMARRVGALPGSADWTHQHGDIANTVKSNDSRVQLPLGILWFGGSSNMDVLPRHGHGPPQQIVGGRLIIQGMNSLSARDVYTGRVLWHREFEDLGTFDVYYDDTYEDTPLDPKYNQVHIPGANARGTNYVVTEDRIYLAVGNQCQILDVTTGQNVGLITLPRDADGDDPEWGFIGVYQNVLLGGVGFAKYRQRLDLEFESDKLFTGNKAGFGSKSLDRAASRSLIGYHRETGEMLWKVDANHSFWHNGIVAGGGKVFCLDRNPSLVEDALRRRGASHPDTYRILAIDALSGDPLWEVREHIFGTWLGYSEQFGLLLQAGAKASDRLGDEVGKGMRVYNANNGSLRWAQDELAYNGPCILHNNWIITNTNAYSVSSGAYDIRTGQQRFIMNPITGQDQPWQITRTYGCNKIIASENLLTFRSGAAGYYDLLNDSGTGNWGGFKSGCTSNLIVADGVLNAPDYTRTCSCSYQNQTSLALVHMPELDQWTNNLSAIQADKDTLVSSVGINFGAPGDRRDSDGVLWIEHPNVAGDEPPLVVQLNEGVQFHKQHSSSFAGSPLPWVTASSAIGVSELRVKIRTQAGPPLEKTDSNSDAVVAATGGSHDGIPVDLPIESNDEHVASYDVTLYFGLPRILAGNEKHIFDVRLKNHPHSTTVVLQESKQMGPNRHSDHALVAMPFASHTFRDVLLVDELVISFDAKQGTPVLSGVRMIRSGSN